MDSEAPGNGANYTPSGGHEIGQPPVLLLLADTPASGGQEIPGLSDGALGQGVEGGLGTGIFIILVHV